MGCEAVLDIMNRLTGMFDHNVLQQYWPVSPHLALTRRGTWPDHIGTTISSQIYGRSAPTVAQPTWTAITVVDGAEAGSCVPQPERVIPGFTNRSYFLSRRRLVSNDICAEDLRFNWEVEKQMSAWVNSFGGRVKLEWEFRDRFEYHKNTKYRVSCVSPLIQHTNWDSNGPGGTLSTDGTNYYFTAGGAALPVPTSAMTWGFLDMFRMKVLRNGALLSALGMENGSPVLTVVASEETINSLKLQVQGDLRWGAPSKLLAPFGVLGSLKGYYLLADQYPRRFEYVGGQFQQVATFSQIQGNTKGEEDEVNPSWETATYEETVIYDPQVYTQLIPDPITSAGSGVTFKPVDYTGRYKLMNIPDRECNPYENIVFMDALLADGDEPQYTMRGVSYIHLRCDPALNAAPCNSVQS